jgi:tetratricopeptide (TPR) repeat protein
MIALAAVPAILLMAPGCSPESRSAALVERGRKSLAAHDVAAATENFRQAVELTPLDPAARYQLALANLAVGDGRGAAEQLSQVIQLKPEDWPAQIKLAELMATSRDPGVLAEAQQRLTRVIARLPGDASAVTALSIVEWKLGHRDQAERRLEHALATLPKRADMVFTLATMKVAAGDTAAAEALLQRAAEGNAAMTIFLAEFYSAMGRFPQAEAALKRALGREPQNAQALLDLASLQAAQNRTSEAATTFRALSSLPDRRYHPLYGLFLLRAGKPDLAIAEFERQWRQDPADHVLRTGLVTAYLEAARESDAQQLLASAVHGKNPDFDALFQKAVLDLGEGRTSDAQAGVLSALRLRPEAAEAHYVLAAVYLRRAQILTSVAELGQALQRDPQFLPARIELARYQIAAKAPEVALDLLAHAPASSQNTPAVAGERLWALVATGDKERFRREFDSVRQSDRTPTLLVEEGLTLLEQRDAAAAGRVAQDLLRTNPADMRGLLLLARSRQVEQGTDAAIDSIRHQAESQPHSVEAWHFLGDLLLAAGRGRMAVAALQTAYAQGGATPALTASLARAELRSGDAAAAENRLTPLVAKDPGNDSARLLLGAVQQMKGEYNLAAKSYRKVLENRPSNVPALYDLAYILVEHAGQPEEALGLAEKATELAPESAAVDDLFGWVLYRRGLDSLAVIHLAEAAASGSARAACHLALVRLHQGDRAAAEKALEEGLRRSPDLPEAAGVRQALHSPQGGHVNPGPIPDPVVLGWSDLGISDNIAVRLEIYQKTRGCEPSATALDAALTEQDARRFTARAIVPLMLCGPRPVLAGVAVAPQPAAGPGTVWADWKNPESILQRQLSFSGMEVGGWDNAFVSWDTDSQTARTAVVKPLVDASDISLRTPLDPPDAAGWSIYDSLWPPAFH